MINCRLTYRFRYAILYWNIPDASFNNDSFCSPSIIEKTFASKDRHYAWWKPISRLTHGPFLSPSVCTGHTPRDSADSVRRLVIEDVFPFDVQNVEFKVPQFRVTVFFRVVFARAATTTRLNGRVVHPAARVQGEVQGACEL